MPFGRPAVCGSSGSTGSNTCAPRVWATNLSLRPGSVRRLSSLRRYAVLRNGELLTVGATEWVLVDYERRTPVQIPEEMRASFRLVAPDAEVLRDMGIRRMVRFAPSPGLAAASK